MKKISVILSVVVAVLYSTDLTAQDLEFRFVNTQYIYSQLMQKEGPVLQQELYRYQKTLADTIEIKQRELQQLQYESQNMQGNELSIARKKIEALNRELTVRQQNYESDMQRKQQDLYKSLGIKMDRAVQAVADQNDIDHVIPTVDPAGNPVILYFSQDQIGQYDITSQVLQYLTDN